MIPVVQERDILSGGSKASASFDISQENVAHILTILRDTLYSDKIMAVLREYGANAWDEHRKCGKADVPIKVQLPTLADPTLRIRDYGPGLSVQDVERIFTKYGASTKRDDNLAVGMLGIGSKSGFAYADSFAVTSWHGGVRREYVAVIDESQKGKMDLLYEQELPCGCGGDHVASLCPKGFPAETGLEISLAVRPQDIKEFETRAKALFVHYVPQPVINTTLPALATGREIGKLGRILEDNGWENRGKWFAIMGCVPYKVQLGQLGQVVQDGVTHSVSPCASNIGGIVRFDIGELQVAASREELKYGDSTRLNIIRRINDLIDEYVREMLQGLDKLTEWERRLRVNEVGNKGLPIPRDREQYKTHYVNLSPSEDGFDDKGNRKYVVRITQRNYNDNQSPCSSIRVLRSARIVVKDDNKRSIKGFDLRQEDVLVAPAGGRSLSACEAEVRRLVRESHIDGVPVVKLSSLPWTAPPRSVAVRDSAKAKAQMLVLDTKQQDFGASPLSRHWSVVSRTASDKDVWVVLDSYRVSSAGLPIGDFYEQWLTDERVLRGVGLQMPAIIGYKEMSAKPVVRSSLKGTEYKDWRKRGLIELLKTHAGMRQTIEAMEDGGELPYDMDVQHLTDHLGEGHPITQLAVKVSAARRVLSKTDRNLISAAKTVRGSESLVDNTTGLRKQIIETYPLLATTMVESAFGLYATHKPTWTDYVKLVDGVNDRQKKEEERVKAA